MNGNPEGLNVGRREEAMEGREKKSAPGEK
jgi:hypothetical protein